MNFRKFKNVFLLGSSYPKIKQSTLSNKYKNGGIKGVYIFSGFQCLWIGTFYVKNFHEYKIVPNRLIKKVLVKFPISFKF